MNPMTVGDFLTLNSARYPDKIALVCKDKRLTYQELNGRVNALAHAFLDLGIGKGDKIGYLFPNSMEIVELFFAIAKIGAIAVPLNHRLVAREIKCLLDLVECDVFVYSRLYDGPVSEVKGSFRTVKHIIRLGEPAPGEYSFEKLLEHKDTSEPDIAVDSGDLFRIQFTGGTTGRSKGVMRTHEADLFQTIGVMTSNKMGASPDEVVLTQSPLHHQGGITWMLCVMVTGAQFVICDGFDPVEILRQIEQERVTYMLLLPPSTYLRLIDAPVFRDYDVSSVKVVHTSAGGTSPAIIQKMAEAFPNCEVYYGWGQTETGAGTVHRITREMALHHPEKTQSIGRPMPFFQLRIVDEAGKDVPLGEVGEGIAKGPAIFSGYYKQPELTDGTVTDGWTRTGDMMRQDEEGLYYMVDRKKDMIKTGGENVFAQEVEAVIRKHPAVLDCSVIGVPDQTFGEAVMAVVKLRSGYTATAADIQEHCKRDLSSYKKPRYVEFLDEFPVDSAGKIQKFRLRKKYREIYSHLIETHGKQLS
ncbi:class I adenylate-forming enzyme family protein [Desulfitobacterium chlororespirans]|uniref:Long-chain acyl-CoA synthetase n=1 Tax=Desulfitobacterium chlororespirans DSM 11544 TaxID=1121395 RepID=A0A1M7SWN5_9FIRM|nr:class I adenylate-forming enzyme family protein [Desulfitobacterium chlororespirans]SHN62861.1 long-chain acyl-CoA synthetase [Desulfitobacterium chlororespirans DSM 11544]